MVSAGELRVENCGLQLTSSVEDRPFVLSCVEMVQTSHVQVYLTMMFVIIWPIQYLSILWRRREVEAASGARESALQRTWARSPFGVGFKLRFFSAKSLWRLTEPAGRADSHDLGDFLDLAV